MTSFGPFRLEAGTLRRNGEAVLIGQRALSLLEALAASDAAVGKDALIEAAWPGVIVEEGNLTVQIAALRKALGPRDDGSEWIVTVPRVGYRLVRGEAKAAVTERPGYRQTVAVLPFQNLSGDASQDYFADGVVEDIITALSRFRNFAVVARNSSFVYKGRAVDVRQIGQDLGVRYVLEGSVRRGGDRLRVTAQLIDAESGAHIWARNFDGKTEDVFAVQDDITASVAGILFPKIEAAEVERARRKPPESLDAYDLVLRATRLYQSVKEPESAEAVRLLQRAIDLDPTYGWAVSMLGQTLHARQALGWPEVTGDDMGLGLWALERALTLASDDAAVLAQVGIALCNTYAQYERGLGLLGTAVAGNPNSVFVLACSSIGYLHCGDLHESIALAKYAIDLSPSDPGQHWALTAISHAQLALGEFEDALRWATTSLAVNADFECTYWMLAAGNAKLGRMDEARRWLAQFRQLRPEVTVQSIRESQPKRYPDRMANILEGLALAGLPEG